MRAGASQASPRLSSPEISLSCGHFSPLQALLMESPYSFVAPTSGWGTPQWGVEVAFSCLPIAAFRPSFCESACSSEAKHVPDHCCLQIPGFPSLLNEDVLVLSLLPSVPPQFRPWSSEAIHSTPLPLPVTVTSAQLQTPTAKATLWFLPPLGTNPLQNFKHPTF